MWSNRVGQNRETHEEHDEDGVEEGFQLARPKFERDDEGGREALGTGNCSISIFFLSGISITSIFKVRVVLH